MTSFFLDSNISVYAFDSGTPAKQVIAQKLLGQVPVISSQVLIETYLACLKKLKLAPAVCQDNILFLCDLGVVVALDATAFGVASQVRQRYSFSFLDSLIVSSALLAGCITLYSEDLQNGLVVDEKLTIVNPFAS